MQLSASVSLPDSPLPSAAPANLGDAVTSPAAGAFAALLPGECLDATPAKKPATPPGSAQEAAAAVWAAWFAVTPPSPQPVKGGEVAGAGDEAVQAAPGAPGTPVASAAQGTTGTSTSATDLFSIRANYAGGLPRAATPQGAHVPVAAAPVTLPGADNADPTAPQAALPATPSQPAPVPAATDALPTDPAKSQTLVSAQIAAVPTLPVDAAALRPATVSGQGPAAEGKRAKLPISGMAKIAAPIGKIAEGVRLDAESANKKILSFMDKQVTGPDSTLGTDNALRPPMPNSALPSHPLASGSAGGSPVALLQPVVASSPTGTSADTALLAHRAVDAVMTATERIDAGNRSVVRLQFSVGDASLSVHVELRAGEVHTTFRTDSPDLRSALASEWQAVNGDSGRAVRLADPVFAPASSHGQSAGFSDGGAQQRHAAREQSQSAPALAFASAPAPVAFRPVAAPVSPAVPAPGSANLYTFA